MSEPVARIPGALLPRYRFERLVGRGGAANVYLAYDADEDRDVAIKVLRDELAGSVSAERFLNEIRVAAQLRHPGIVPIHESGETNGVPFYVMPFIGGETLRWRLTRLGRLRLPEVLHITEDLARALDFAHRRRVVHRDIKPANVMIDHGRAMLLDFGIALDAAAGLRHTSPDLTLGTVEYMSPEQAAGERQIDRRSDIYSLACVVYEMLSGTPPFTGPPTLVMHRHLHTPPLPLSLLRPDVPQEVSDVLDRALAKNPAHRHDTVGELLADLRRAAREGPPPPTIGVLAFVYLRNTPTIDAISDRVTEEVISSIRDLGGVEVAARTCVPNPVEDRQSIQQLGRALDAQALLFGSVSGTGTPLVLEATLLDARSGKSLWSGRAAGDLTNGQELAREPASQLGRTVSEAFLAQFGRKPRRRVSSRHAEHRGNRQRTAGSVTAETRPARPPA